MNGKDRIEAFVIANRGKEEQMSEDVRVRRVPVDTYRVVLHCRHCEVEMIRLGAVLMMSPPQYQYKCPNPECNSEYQSAEVFPRTEHTEQTLHYPLTAVNEEF